MAAYLRPRTINRAVIFHSFSSDCFTFAAFALATFIDPFAGMFHNRLDLQAGSAGFELTMTHNWMSVVAVVVAVVAVAVAALVIVALTVTVAVPGALAVLVRLSVAVSVAVSRVAVAVSVVVAVVVAVSVAVSVSLDVTAAGCRNT